MDEKNEQPDKELLQWVESKSGCPEIYGNYFNTTWTLYDVRFVIGALVPKNDTHPAAGFVVEKRGAVTFAWPEVKILVQTLAGLLHRYELTNGEIKPLKLTPASLPKDTPSDLEQT